MSEQKPNPESTLRCATENLGAAEIEALRQQIARIRRDVRRLESVVAQTELPYPTLVAGFVELTYNTERLRRLVEMAHHNWMARL